MHDFLADDRVHAGRALKVEWLTGKDLLVGCALTRFEAMLVFPEVPRVVNTGGEGRYNETGEMHAQTIRLTRIKGSPMDVLSQTHTYSQDQNAIQLRPLRMPRQSCNAQDTV